MFAVAYGFDIGKGVSVGLSHARINNGANATYNFLTSSSKGLSNVGPAAGENPRMWGLTFNYLFGPGI